MIPALILFLVSASFRIALGIYGDTSAWLPNFAPLAAMALCGPLLFRRPSLALGLPLAILLVSDVVLNLHFGASPLDGGMLSRYVALSMIALLGFAIRGRAHAGGFLVAAFGGSAGFYLLTNTACWLTSPGYAKSVAGWIQALTVGLPGYPPTWLFLRNSVVSDLLFTTLILGCLAIGRRFPANQTVSKPDTETLSPCARRA
jgi:hypothetical protein